MSESLIIERQQDGRTSVQSAHGRAWLKQLGEVWARATQSFGRWALSVIATLVLPSLPLGIELLRDGHMKADTLFVTAAVLAATFAFTAEHMVNFSLYLLLFVVNLMIDVASSPITHEQLDHWAGTLLVVTAVLHSCERAWWHLVLDRSFPDATLWRKH